MILPIYAYGSPVLRQKAEPITPDYPGLKELIAILKAHLAFYGALTSVAKKRRALNIPYHIPGTIYQKSILVQYFIRKVKRFSELKG